MPGEILVGLFDEDGHEPLDAGYARVRAPLTNHELRTKRTSSGFLGIFDKVEHVARAVTQLPIIFGPFSGAFEVDKFGIWVAGMGPVFIDYPAWPAVLHAGNTLTIPAGWPIEVS